MSKRLDSPLKWVEEENGLPRAFRWQGRRIVVNEILDQWEEAGCWWQGEPARRVYRVQAASGAVFELHHQPPALGARASDRAGTCWRLYRGYD